MHAWEAIQKTLNHMEKHLGEEIRIEELAEIAGLSLFYYQRLPTREYVLCGFESENHEQMIICLGKAMRYTRFWLKKHNLIADGFFPEVYYKSRSDITYVELWIPFKKREK